MTVKEKREVLAKKASDRITNTLQIYASGMFNEIEVREIVEDVLQNMFVQVEKQV